MGAGTRRDEEDGPHLAELKVNAVQIVTHKGQKTNLVMRGRVGPSRLVQVVQVQQGLAENSFPKSRVFEQEARGDWAHE